MLLLCARRIVLYDSILKISTPELIRFETFEDDWKSENSWDNFIVISKPLQRPFNDTVRDLTFLLRIYSPHHLGLPVGLASPHSPLSVSTVTLITGKQTLCERRLVPLSYKAHHAPLLRHPVHAIHPLSHPQNDSRLVLSQPKNIGDRDLEERSFTESCRLYHGR